VNEELTGLILVTYGLSYSCGWFAD